MRYKCLKFNVDNGKEKQNLEKTYFSIIIHYFKFEMFVHILNYCLIILININKPINK